MNYWKYIVIALLSSVAVFHVGAIFYIGDRDYQLTSTDYYDREIAYQSTLEAMRAGKAYIWTTEERGDELLINVRDANQQALQLETPSVHLYKPSDNRQDQDQVLAMTEPGCYRLKIAQLKPGPWNLTLTAKAAGQPIAWQTRLLRR